MQPLVRILVRNGVSFSELSEILKNVFVEVSERDFNLPGRKTSQSRIAILTGLTRKEVAKQKSILDSGGALNAVSNLNRVTRVLVGWHTDPDFTGPYGMPLELPFESGSGSSFVGLVRKHSGDMAPRAMLDELLRVGAVERLGSGSLKVLMRTYIPQSFLHPDALQRFGEVVRDFINTYEFNIGKRPGLGRFERIVFADDGLREDLLPAFDSLIRTKGLALLIELDNWMSAQELSATAKNKDAKRVKTGVGVYHFVSQEDDKDDLG
jgi:hypothetical protein